MRRFVVYVIMGVALSASAQSKIDSRKEAIVALENRWLASLDDPQALEAILADDFVHVLPSGIITKQQQLDYQRKHPRSDRRKRSFDDLRVRVYGDVAIANGIVVAEGSSGAKQKTYFTDVFAKRNGRWRAVNAQENPEQTPADGQKN